MNVVVPVGEEATLIAAVGMHDPDVGQVLENLWKRLADDDVPAEPIGNVAPPG
ncbi:MAG: hypothetical protein ACXWZT_07800 [Gaiellaceae bacterium]